MSHHYIPILLLIKVRDCGLSPFLLLFFVNRFYLFLLNYWLVFYNRLDVRLIKLARLNYR